MFKRLGLTIGVLAALMIGAAIPAQATVDSQYCTSGAVGNEMDGCIHMVTSGTYVTSDQPGASWDAASHGTDDHVCKYGAFKVGQQNPGGPLNVIHTSSFATRCFPFDSIVWGFTYTQNRFYTAGTVFCGWYSTDYQRKGCVTIQIDGAPTPTADPSGGGDVG